MDWFRVYHNIIDDPKILALPRTFRWHVVELLAVSSRQADRGTLPSMKEIAIHLRLSESKARHIVETLVSSGFVDVSLDGARLSIHGWNKRQFKSDDVSSRTAGWRERSCERSQNVPVNGPDTDTDTEQKKDPPTPRKRGKPAAPADELVLPAWMPAEVWSEFVEMRKKLKVPTPQSFKHIVKELGRLRALGHSPEAVLSRSIINSWAGVFAVPTERVNGFHSSDKPKPPEPITITNKSREQVANEAMARAREQEQQSRREGAARKALDEATRPE